MVPAGGQGDREDHIVVLGGLGGLEKSMPKLCRGRRGVAGG